MLIYLNPFLAIYVTQCEMRGKSGGATDVQ